MDGNVFQHRRILVVEDEYVIAESLWYDLENAGAIVIGPAPSVTEALALVESSHQIEAAVLDINLQGKMAFPVADALITRGIPFVFATGYDKAQLQGHFPDAVRCEKPFELPALAQAMTIAIGKPGTANPEDQPSAKPASRNPWA